MKYLVIACPLLMSQSLLADFEHFGPVSYGNGSGVAKYALCERQVVPAIETYDPIACKMRKETRQMQIANNRADEGLGCPLDFEQDKTDEELDRISALICDIR